MSTYTYTDPATITNLPANLTRNGSGPLDNSTVFASIDDFEYYISKGVKTGLTLTPKFQEYVSAEAIGYDKDYFKPYVGQICSVIDAFGKLQIFQITELNNTEHIWTYQKINPLNGKSFDFNSKTIGAVLKDVVEALGGTVTNA